MGKKKTKVYVCSSLRPKVVKRVDKLLPVLAKRVDYTVDYFRPRGTAPSGMMQTVREDVDAINACDELWLVGDYGRDCSFELGYALAIGKKIVVWTDRTNRKKFDSDWMVKIGDDLGLLEVHPV